MGIVFEHFFNFRAGQVFATILTNHPDQPGHGRAGERICGCGRRFTITNRGEAVADLVPSAAAQPRDLRQAIEKFEVFMRANPVTRRVDLKALIEEGRA